MASKNLLAPFNLGTLDLNGAAQSAETNVKSIDLISVQINATGAPVGEFFVEGTNDADPQTGLGINWVPLDLNPTAIVEGAATQILINLRMVAFMKVRVTYSRVSGTGSATVIVAGKGL